MKHLFLIILCACYSTMAFAQLKNTSTDHPLWSIKLSPLGLIEPDQALSLATEVRIKSHFGFQLEGSYLFNTWYLAINTRTVTNTQGFRIVPEFRYYDVNFKNTLHRYVGLQLSYKQLEKDVEEWTAKPNFIQLETTHLKKNNMTATVLLGLQNHAKLIGFDFNLGLGFKYKTLFNNEAISNNNLINTHLGESFGGYYPQLSATFKLCVKII